MVAYDNSRVAAWNVGDMRGSYAKCSWGTVRAVVGVGGLEIEW